MASYFITRKLPFSVSLSRRCRHHYNNLKCAMCVRACVRTCLYLWVVSAGEGEWTKSEWVFMLKFQPLQIETTDTVQSYCYTTSTGMQPPTISIGMVLAAIHQSPLMFYCFDGLQFYKPYTLCNDENWS